jgi:hypothetical protein
MVIPVEGTWPSTPWLIRQVSNVKYNPSGEQKNLRNIKNILKVENLRFACPSAAAFRPADRSGHCL